MKENFAKLSNNLIFFAVILSTLISTLFFLPTTSEFFEFNKFTAILFITIGGILLWAVRMLIEKRFGFTKTPLDIPILILLVVYFVASLTSIDQFGSLVGSQGRVWPAFFPLVTVSALYFLATSNLKSKKQVEVILWTLVGATTVASVISTLSYFGAFAPFEFAQIRTFSTLGNISRLATLEAFVIPMTISWAIFSHNKNIRLTAAILTVIMTFSFVLIGFIPAYVILAASLIFLIIGSLKSKIDKSAQGTIAVIAVFAVLFLVMRYVPQVAKGTLQSWIRVPNQQEASLSVASDVKLPNSTSWDVATQAIGKRPLFGTGPSTFTYAYTQLKPRSMNATDQWAVRFDKPSSLFSEIITETGVFGTLAYLLFIIVVLRFIWTLTFKSAQNTQYLPLCAAVAGATVASFVTTSSFSTIVPLFVALACLAIIAKATDENYVFDLTVELATLKNRLSWFPIGTTNDLIKASPEGKGAKSQVLPTIFLVIILVASLFAARHQIAAYRGEYYYRQALLAARSNDGNRTVSFLQKAINANPRVDTYHRVLSSTTLNAAINLSSQQNLNEDQRRLLLQLAQVAIDQGKVASGYQILPLRLPGISAANVANWETLAAVYQAMIGSINGSDVHAVNTLSQAVSLDPQNPILHDRLGLLYQRVKNTDLAQRKFEDAIIVKQNYGPARYHLAKLLIEQNGDVSRIVTELNAAARDLPGNDPAIPDINANLDTYNQKLQELQKQQSSAQPEASPKPGESPGPSATPSPSSSASPSPSPAQSPSL